MTNSSLMTAYKTFAEQASPYLHITNEAEYSVVLEELEALLDTASDTLNDPLNPLIELISNAIESYESKDAELALFIEEATNEKMDIVLLRTLMASHNLTGSDLPEIGDKTMVSKVLNNKRMLQRPAIEALAERFGIRPALFFGG